MPWLEFSFFLVLTFLFASVEEWVIHKHFMHTTKFGRIPFERHAVKHHAERRAPGRFRAKADDLKEYHLFETSFMPVLWILHFPAYLVAWWLAGEWACFGVIAGAGAYILSYELLHWYMHCEDAFPFRHHRWFKFLSEHHRRHHHRARINYNVVFPLGDLLFGTFSMEEVKPEPETLAGL